MAIEKIEINYYGTQAEVVYQPRIKEMVFQTNPKVAPFLYSHKTFNNVTEAQWQQLKIRLTSACSRPATAALNKNTLPAKVS